MLYKKTVYITHHEYFPTLWQPEQIWILKELIAQMMVDPISWRARIDADIAFNVERLGDSNA